MKKKTFIVLCVAFLACLLIGAFGIILAIKKPTYKLEQTLFNQVVAYNGEIDLNNLSIIKQKGNKTETIPISADMIVSGIESNKIGKSQIVIKYDNETFVVDITIKYKIEFVVNGEVVSIQYVLDEDEIIYPEDPRLEGCEFVEWCGTKYLDDNSVYHAMFKLSNPTKTFKFNATYGDSLSDINLPENQYGKWVFVDDVTTSVGEASTNYKNFNIKFVPDNRDCVLEETGVAQIKVNKKKLKFKNVQNLFTYDGTEKKPTYELDVEGLNVEYELYFQGGKAINAGTYEYDLKISDTNYTSDIYHGSFKISKVFAKVVVQSMEIGLFDPYPESFPYKVFDENGELLDSELVNLMDIKVIEPYYKHADTYEISAQVNNANFDYLIESGYLTVNKAEFDLDETPPNFVGGPKVTYGNLLSSVEFINDDVRGLWQWEDESIKVLTPTSFVANAKFIPYETNDYLISEKEVVLEVQKKNLTIEVSEREYTYDGKQHNVKYDILGIEKGDSVSVFGNRIETTAGNYEVKLVVNLSDLRYVGSIQTTLVINQKSIADFSKVYAKEWNKTLTLENIQLDECYNWVNPLTPITEIGEQSYIAQFTPEDDVNYKTEKGFIKIDISKANASIQSLENYEFEYNPNGYSLTSVDLPHNEVELKYIYKKDGLVVDKISSVGNYDVELILEESEHYNRITKSLKVSVFKVRNNDVVVLNQNAEYEETLEKFTLPKNDFGEWVWVEGNSTVGTVGVQTHIAKFIPKDKVNYEEREVEVTFDVSKKPILVPSIQPKIFNNQLQVANISNTSYYKVVENKGGTYKGLYDVVLELVDPNNYCWKNELEETSKITVEFEILKNNSNDWIKTPQLDGWKFGNQASVPSAESLFGDFKVEYKLVDTLDAFSSNVPSKAGKYYAKFNVEETESYNGLETVVEFNIDYLIVPVPVLENKVYNGIEQTADISENEYYKVTSNDGRVNAGTYDVVLTLKNESFKWADSYELNKTLEFVIEKVKNSDEVPKSFDAKYGDKLSKFSLTISETGVWTWLEGEDSLVGNAGVQEHKIKFVPSDPVNYETREEVVKINVAKETINQPIINAKVFNNETQTADVLDSENYIVVQNNGGVNAGKYDVVFELKDPDNYRWGAIDENEKTLTLKFEIVKNESNKWLTVPDIDGWKYGETSNEPVANALFGEALVEYKSKSQNDEYSKNKPVKAGSYIARFSVSGNDNYNGLGFVYVEFNIEFVEVQTPQIQSKTYNKEFQLAEIEQSDKYSVVTENLMFKNAGKYEIIVKLNNESYKWNDSYDLEKTIIFEITKVKNEDDVVLNREATFGDVLNSTNFELPNNANGTWVWENEGTTVGNAGVQKHFAKFVPVDETNYESRVVQVIFEVAKKIVQKPIIKEETYNGENQVANISSNLIYEVVQNNGGKETGEYDVVLKLIDPSNYYWAGFADEEQITLKFKITGNVSNSWLVEPSIAGWVYGQTANAPVAQSEYGECEVYYKLLSDGDEKYSKEVPSNAGTYVAKFVVEPTESYEGLTHTVQFNIEYIIVPVPTIANSVYNEEAQTADIQETEYYEVSVNDEHVDAGTYDVVLKLKNSNYKWSDSFDLNKTVKFTIEKADNKDEFDTYKAVYGDTLGKFNLLENSKGEWIWETGKETLVGVVGNQKHVAVFTPYNENNYNSRRVEINFEVDKKELLVPEVESKTYNGEEQSSELENTDIYTVKNVTGVNKGEYDVKVTLVDFDNYCWKADKENKTIVIKFNILKYNNNKWEEGKTPSIGDWVYGETPAEPTGKAEFGEIVVEYRLKSNTEGEYSKTKPVKAGTYLARFSVEGTSNYNGIDYELVEFDIEYVVVQTPALKSKVYNAQPQKADIAETDNYSVTFNELNTNAGTYDVVVTLKDDSFKWNDSYVLSKTLQFVIEKVKNNDKFDVINAKYEDSLGDHKLVKDSPGVWAWKAGDETLVGVVGAQKHMAVFTPNDKLNYEGRELEIEFNVAKRDLSTPEVAPKTYNGKEQTSELENTSIYTVKNVTGVNKGEYDVEVTLVDFDNYCWKADNEKQTIVAKFNILKNTSNDWVVAPSIADWVYYKDPQGSPVGEAMFGNLVAEYKLQSEEDSSYSTTCPSNAGNYNARFSIVETENYNGLDYVYDDFVVEKHTVYVSPISSSVYNGSEQTATVETSSFYNIIKNDSHVNAGSHEVVLQLINGNFKWSDSENLEKTLYFVINKATDNDWVSGPTMNSFVYTPDYNSDNEGVASAKYGAVIVKYLENGEYLEKLPKNVGTYSAEFYVEETDNYVGVSPKTIGFNITQETPNFTCLSIETPAYENSCSEIILETLEADVDGTFEIESKPVLETTSQATYSNVGFTVSFTPTDAHNYKSLTGVEANINLNVVCYNGSTYYGSIDNALEKSTSGTITVIPNTSRDITIATNSTVASGVTLSLPYLTTSGGYGVNNTSGKATLHFTGGSNDDDPTNAVQNTSDLKLTSRVVIKNGVTLTNNGTIMIAGETSGGRGGSGLAGHTARNFAEIEMEPNAKIISTGTIHCFGFIDVSDLNDASSQVIIQSGTLYMPFVVADFRGGTFMKEAYTNSSNKVTPFNQFEFRNIVSSLRINQGAFLIGHGNLYARLYLSPTNNHAEAKLIGNDSNYLINLSSGAYIESKYTPVRSSVDNNNKWTDGVNTLNFYGGAITNSLKMKVVGVTVNTSDVDFPLTWRFKINLYSGSYTMSNNFKMMPGAELTVQKGATLTIDTISIYSGDWTDKCPIGPTTCAYKSNVGAPKLIVRGTLISNVAIGGIVYSDTNDAIVQIKGANTAPTKEMAEIVEETKSFFGYTYTETVYHTETLSNSLVLKSATNIDEAISTGTFVSSVNGDSSSTYKMVNGVWVKQ